MHECVYSAIEGQLVAELSDGWECRLEGEALWRPVSVPGCWELAGIAKECAGPVWYRASVAIPAQLPGSRLWLRFAGVSYHCEISVNGVVAGAHTGLWDAFAVELTSLVTPGTTAELLLRIEKPAASLRGPGSPAAPGRFALRETLAGFLPYVWGQIFGGIWQPAALVATGEVYIEDVAVDGSASGQLRVEVALSAGAGVQLELRDPGGALLGLFEQRADPIATFELQLERPQLWSPRAPSLYQARLTTPDGDERQLRFGLRSLEGEGAGLSLNGAPLYPRMALSWGWYPDALSSNPGPERVRADFARLKSLGYNGVKLCLWFPPQYYFELADELGMLLWVELPMWLPLASPFFLRQTPLEYERLVRLARNHPAVLLYTLGCELNSEVGAELLEPLYQRVRALAGAALVCDNSGTGAAYGGLLNEYAQFDDYHFYSDPHLLRPLLDAFTPRWRPARPWLFGEFCDYDTLRDPRALVEAGGVGPWWTSADPAVNPQGARWQFDLVDHARRLAASGLAERAPELARLSHLQGLLHRKLTLELVRSYPEVSGYVVSGEADTPITTAGMWDDHGRLKFEPAAFRAFNDDSVLLLGWDQCRAWVAGGDRHAGWDYYSYQAGALVRPHMLLAHHGGASVEAIGRWEALVASQPPGAPPRLAGNTCVDQQHGSGVEHSDATLEAASSELVGQHDASTEASSGALGEGGALASGELRSQGALAPGGVRELGVAEFRAPMVREPRALLLRASAQLGAEQLQNSWRLWVYPRVSWPAIPGLALADPYGRLAELRGQLPAFEPATGQRVVIATAWSPGLERWLGAGGRAVLLQRPQGPPGPLPLAELPFWREALRLVAPHPAWRDFPHEGCAGAQLWGMACDGAFDLSAATMAWRPILRRLDTRSLALHEYAVDLDWGHGRLIASTLRFEGGLGDQPLGIGRSVAASYLLWCWCRTLAEGTD